VNEPSPAVVDLTGVVTLAGFSGDGPENHVKGLKISPPFLVLFLDLPIIYYPFKKLKPLNKYERN
jgi:hypothetical protein